MAKSEESRSEESAEKTLSRASNFILGIAAISTTILGFSAWINTRASKDEVEEALEKVKQEAIRTCSLSASKEDVIRLEKRMDKTEEIVIKIDKNVVRIIERQRMKPKEEEN